MLLVAPLWMLPTPAKANVQQTQIVVEKPTDDGSRVLRPEQNIQPRDNQPSQKSDVSTPKPTEPRKNNSPTLQKPKQTVSVDKAETSGRNKTYSKEEVINLINVYSILYGISPEIPLAIAKCESGYRYNAKNGSSTASGVFQWLSKSWRNQPASQNGDISPFNADANVQAAVWLIAHGKTSPWNASKSCWK